MSSRALIGIIIFLSVVAVWIYLIVAPMPKLPIGIANGTYHNDCCADINLEDGLISAGHQQVGYVIERDKVGAYVLPTAYVGISGAQISIDRAKSPIILRLDSQDAPTSLNISSRDEVFVFIRQNSLAR